MADMSCRFNSANAVICDDRTQCHRCGWNPEVAEDRIFAYKNRKVENTPKLTLEEAIQRALEESERLDLCLECREEHRQLAEWLAELKDLRLKLKLKER